MWIMVFQTLISTEDLAGHLEGDWAVVDVRFSLNDPDRGYRDYLVAHIPGAVYAHLNEDLSGPVVRGKTGRHPLPSVEVFAETLGRWGIDEHVQVVAYDDAGGMIAARLWWMLRWLGHDAVAVLDGGIPRWREEGRPTVGGRERREARTFTPHLRQGLSISTREVESLLHNASWKLVDSRAPERYRGEQEPIDAVAGHIPGALNAPHQEVLDRAGCFLPAEQLRRKFNALLGDHPVKNSVFYCGSGVSAAHNLLALAHAGLGEAMLYPGSWSEWITEPGRPVATGC